ncbi:MAG TPA: YceI family protein [Bacteroidales bacterium]|nr:YceI family protein [Bacteroidales bacterium]
MKTLKVLGVLLLAGTLSVSAQKSEINPGKSVVTWTGNKIGGSHTGGIKVKSGYLDFKKGDITSGEVVMDMNSITNTDLKDEGYNQKLVGHLKSEDFFGVEKYPTSTFKITKATKFKDGKATLTGVLTIKGKSENISVDVAKKGNTYSSQLKVDRSKFDVRYGSKSFFDNLGDKVIDDIFILDIQLGF